MESENTSTLFALSNSPCTIMTSLSRLFPSTRAALPALASVIACATLTACGGGGGGGSSGITSVFSGTYSLLYSFLSNPDGQSPQYGQLAEYNGYLYGTTEYGGQNGTGAIVKFAPGSSPSVIYSFGSSTSGDGNNPLAGLILANDGNFYGTTYSGGANGKGAVFKVTPSGTETIVYSFGSQANDGENPYAGVIQATDGNLYGVTTNGGGTHNAGTVFKLTLGGTETTLYSFGTNSSSDAVSPQASLIQASDGNLYGTAYHGGAHSAGAVFKVTTSGAESLVYSFGTSGADGASPLGGLIQASDGALYGTTTAGGAHGAGTVFKVTLAGLPSIVYAFGSRTGEGQYPQSTLVQASDGNFYGTTTNGGAYMSGNSGGVVFEVTPGGGEAVLHSFAATGDGNNPIGGLTIGSDGHLYGTTSAGGSNGYGTIFQIQ